MSKKRLLKRARGCPFSMPDAPQIDYRDTDLLKQFISEETGKLLPSRITRVSCKYQRHLAVAVKRARALALLPYTQHEE